MVLSCSLVDWNGPRICQNTWRDIIQSFQKFFHRLGHWSSRALILAAWCCSAPMAPAINLLPCCSPVRVTSGTVAVHLVAVSDGVPRASRAKGIYAVMKVMQWDVRRGQDGRGSAGRTLERSSASRCI